jgi:tetratricopeptide (TPR) repeat protein
MSISNAEESIENNNKLIELKQNNSNALMCNGIVLKNLNKLDEAIECFNKSIQINPIDSFSNLFKFCDCL